LNLKASVDMALSQPVLALTRIIVLAVPLLAIGCGGDAPELAPAGGMVTHDGTPLADADVLFIPEAGGPTAVGRTGSDGKFQLTTGGIPGAVIGKHKVAVQAAAETSAGQTVVEGGEFIGEIKSRIPATYGNYEMSGLTADVTADGENNFTFELTGAP
jgi:hypothetical protein